MSKSSMGILVAVIVGLVGISVFYFMRLPKQERIDPAVYSLGTYGYRCEDGTEFTMLPSEDGSSVLVVPASNVERIHKSALKRVESENGAKFAAGDLTFFAHGETVELSGESFATKCSPLSVSDQAPFNFGD